MLAYLTIPAHDGLPPQRVDYNGIARLFAHEDLGDEPATAPLTPVRRFAATFQAAMMPLAEMAALLRDEHRARRRESRQSHPTRA